MYKNKIHLLFLILAGTVCIWLMYTGMFNKLFIISSDNNIINSMVTNPYYEQITQYIRITTETDKYLFLIFVLVIVLGCALSFNKTVFWLFIAVLFGIVVKICVLYFTYSIFGCVELHSYLFKIDKLLTYDDKLFIFNEVKNLYIFGDIKFNNISFDSIYDNIAPINDVSSIKQTIHANLKIKESIGPFRFFLGSVEKYVPIVFGAISVIAVSALLYYTFSGFVNGGWWNSGTVPSNVQIEPNLEEIANIETSDTNFNLIAENLNNRLDEISVKLEKVEQGYVDIQSLTDLVTEMNTDFGEDIENITEKVNTLSDFLPMLIDLSTGTFDPTGGSYTKSILWLCDIILNNFPEMSIEQKDQLLKIKRSLV